VGVPQSKSIKEILNSDDIKYGGSGVVNDTIKIEKQPWHNKEYSIEINLPPLAGVILKPNK